MERRNESRARLVRIGSGWLESTWQRWRPSTLRSQSSLQPVLQIRLLHPGVRQQLALYFMKSSWLSPPSQLLFPLQPHLNTPTHPASPAKLPLRASSPLFGPDFGRVGGTRRKGMDAPAKAQLKSLAFPLSTKTDKSFLIPFPTAVFSPQSCCSRGLVHTTRLSVSPDRRAVYARCDSLPGCRESFCLRGGFFLRLHDWSTTGKITLHDSP